MAIVHYFSKLRGSFILEGFNFELWFTRIQRIIVMLSYTTLPMFETWINMRSFSCKGVDPINLDSHWSLYIKPIYFMSFLIN